MRLIDADALKGKKIYSEERHEYVIPVFDIDNAPTVDAAPMVHGRWAEKRINNSAGFEYTNYWCSVCGRKLIGCSDSAEAQYCHCGARVDGGEEE